MILQTAFTLTSTLCYVAAISSHLKHRHHHHQDQLSKSDHKHTYYHQASAVMSDQLNSSSVIIYDVAASGVSLGFTKSNSYVEMIDPDANSDNASSTWSSSLSTSRSSAQPVSSSDASLTTMIYIVVFTTLFFIVGSVGIVGNAMVVYIILTDSKMRR